LSGSSPLSVTYLLEDTALFGGVKVILRQANLLARRGHRVEVVSKGPEPTWFDLEAGFRQVPSFEPGSLEASDVTLATFWTTVEPALRSARGEVAHYCQGFEASYTHNQAEHPAILAAYGHRIPALAVAPHLVDLLRQRFGRPARVVPQPLEPFFRPREAEDPTPSKTPRILVTAPFEIDWKGVKTALLAARQLKEAGLAFDLVRLSQWPQTEAEKEIIRADEFHTHLTPEQAARLVRSCDLLLAPSWEQEGFGLPVLEAMASGVPVIASDIACFRGFAGEAARLVPFDQPAAFAAAAKEALESSELWLKLRRAGLEVVERSYGEEQATARAEEALRWVATGAWRQELDR